MSRPTVFGLALAALLATAAAQAATPINEQHPLDPRGRVEVENLKGLVHVRGWDRNEVRIEGSLGAGVEKLEIDPSPRRLRIVVKYPNRGGGLGFFGGADRSGPTELRLMVPLRADLGINVVSADVDVQGVAPDELGIDSVSGDVVVAAAPRKASIDSVSGDLTLTLNSSQVEVESVSGDIVLRGRLDGEVSVETVSGDAEVEVRERSLARLDGASVSGDLRVRTALAPRARVSLETVSGDVRLQLPRDVSAAVRGESFSGTLSAPGATIQRPRRGPGSSFEHRYGDGSAEVRIETFSGDARLQLD